MSEVADPLPCMDPNDYRRAIGCFATGVAIVTTAFEGELHGMTVNSLTSVSLRPTLLLVCLTRPSRTATAVDGSGAFVVNLLGEDQSAVSDRFARPRMDHFSDSSLYRLDADGLPLIAGALGHLTCETEAQHAGGDHSIVIGRVTKAAMAPREPLIFHRGSYDTLTGSRQEAALAWYW
jgi:flavin reductase (DIM6/NTAB) family NADH-FMN oxidoreductase RutF